LKLELTRRYSLSMLVGLIALSTSIAGAATIDERLAPCLACHGEKGQSQIPEVPSLGAQPEFFLSVQLLMFRDKMRDIEPMSGMIKGWSDEDLRRATDALAKLPPPNVASQPPDAARVERARALVEQHRCNFCHKQDFSVNKTRRA
jgi:cytochrome c553